MSLPTVRKEIEKGRCPFAVSKSNIPNANWHIGHWLSDDYFAIVDDICVIAYYPLPILQTRLNSPIAIFREGIVIMAAKLRHILILILITPVNSASVVTNREAKVREAH